MSKQLSKYEDIRVTLTKEIRELQHVEKTSQQAVDSCAAPIAKHITELAKTFDVKKDFYAFAEKELGFKKTHVNNCLLVQRNFLDRYSGREGVKLISFNGLVALSKDNVSRGQVEKIVKHYGKCASDPIKYRLLTAKEIKSKLNNRLGPPELPPTHDKEESKVSMGRIHLLPEFERRLAECLRIESSGGEPVGGSFLFALRSDATESDIKIVARHYKQKYHPDKGGDQAHFGLISEYEKTFILEQKSKYGI